MRVLALSACVPFGRSNLRNVQDHLVENLNLTPGVQAAGMCLPFVPEPWTRLPDEMLIARGLRIEGIDRLIPLAFPATLVEHTNVVPWLAYPCHGPDAFAGTDPSNIPSTPEGRRVSGLIRAAVEAAFAGSPRIFAVPRAAEQLRVRYGIAAQALAVPPNDPWLFAGGTSDDYVLAPSQAGRSGRIELLLDALRHAPGVRLVLAEAEEPRAGRSGLRRIMEAYGVADRVMLARPPLSRAALASLVNAASAVACIPAGERAGSLAAEAFLAGKPVITTTDSPGVLDLVRHGETGWAVDPDPAALGSALEEATRDHPMSAERGRAGRATLDALGLNWPRTVECLLS